MPDDIPPKATVAAGREGRMGSSNLLQLPTIRLISDDYTPTEEVISLPPLQLPVAAWWEGWKEWSTTPQLFSCSSLTLLFYLLLLYYMLSESLLYSVPPAVYDLSNPSPDLLSLHHHPIPTGSMGGWVKVPGHYSSNPRAPPWQHRTKTWAIHHNTTSFF